MSSTRLPGKVMADLVGAPMILRQIERLKRAKRLDQIVVATSTDASDDGLAERLVAEGIGVYRGSLEDVLGRFVGALETFSGHEIVVRLTADCPLADPDLIDETIALFESSKADYASNTPERRSYPKGLDIEVMRADVLRTTATEATDPYDREHVTPFIYRHPERFKVVGLEQHASEGEVRWTVDRPDDLDFVRAVYEALYPRKADFTSNNVRVFVQSRPDLWAMGGDRRY
jgi:spore coat polysaccharide biosynthesis protein SpsF